MRLSAIYSFLYLFIMDTVEIPFKTFEEYENNEPGFAMPFFEAYVEGFNLPADGIMSHTLFKNINKIATRHLESIQGGKYRAAAVSFGIKLDNTEIPFSNIDPNEIAHFTEEQRAIVKKMILRLQMHYNGTEQGLSDFISFWFRDPATCMHTFDFCLGKSLLYRLTCEDKRIVFKDNFQDATYDSKKHLPLIKELARDGKLSFTIISQAKNKILEQQMQSIFEGYHQDISVAQTDDNKIRTIVKYIQRIEQLHPFADGNIRTCLIVLNKLLRDHNLSPTILLNPNRLDCCTLDEVIQMVKEGQTLFQALLKNTNSNEFIANTTNQLMPDISCPPHQFPQSALLDTFVQTVIKKPKYMENPGRHGLFESRKFPQALLKEIQPFLNRNRSGSCATIREFINNQAYSVAFRKACYAGEYLIIQAMLNMKDNLQLDINETSSNGNSALDWFDQRAERQHDSLLSEETRCLLLEHGVRSNKSHSMSMMKS